MKDGTERVHDGGPEARAQRKRERAEAARRSADREDETETERGSVRKYIDRLTGHGQEDR